MRVLMFLLGLLLFAGPLRAATRDDDYGYSYRYSNFDRYADCSYCQRRLWRVPDRPRKSVGRLDARLSKACQDGDFLPRFPALYVVMARDADLDVAWSDGTNLMDTGKLAKPGEVYLFFAAGRLYRQGLSSECEVYVRQ